MPGKVGVKIKAGRNLPVMDRGSDTTDAYVEIKLGSVTHKTDVCRKSLNPQWNTDWFRFEVDDAELQDEPLQIRLMDHDTYSANDAIGKVYISLNPLCLETASQSNQGKGAVMSGWIPVFDTMHGIRGEVNIIVKVDLFSDANKFRQSSCGVQFFHSPNIPHGYKAQVIHGFVEELVVNDDPEYQWIDKIRTPRASNEARQVVFLKLSGQVQRKIGLKAINLGANAVIGYSQYLDLEGDVGVVARGIGTAVTLVKIQDSERAPSVDNALIEERTLKYLEFLKGGISPSDARFRSVFDCNTLSGGTSGNVVYKILGIDPLERVNTKAPNVVLSHRWRPDARDSIIPEETSEGEGMTKLLQQEDMRGQKSKQKFRHHMKRITRSSKNLFNEKLNALKTKTFEKYEQGGGSLNSSFSDISYAESIRSSLTDLGGLIKLRRSKSNQAVSGGSGMASLIVNSIMHGPSLNSISEGRDSIQSTPSQKIKFRSDIKAESEGNLSQKEKQLIPQLSSDSKANVTQSFEMSGSISSLSSSATEEGFSEVSETTTPNEIVVVDADTVSMVVKSVLAQESRDNDSDNWIQPGSTRDENDNSPREMIAISPSFSSQNNPMKSQNKKQLPEGHYYDTDSTEKNISTDSGIVTMKKTNSFNLGDIIKEPSFDEDFDKWIQPGSTVDEPETIDERRGSLLHDLKENLSETFHHIQEHIHLPHFNDEKLKLSKQHTLDDNAMNQNRSQQRERVKLFERRRGSLDGNKMNLSFSKNTKREGELLDESGAIGNAIKSILMEPLKLADEIEEQIKESSTNQENISSETTLHTRAHPIIVVNEDISFYSSEPELINRYAEQASDLKAPFTSLTNLNTSAPNSPCSMPNPICIANSSYSSSTVNLSSPPQQFVFNKKSFSDITSPLPFTSHSVNSENARNEFLSSSDINLSSTNKAQMLAPFPHLKQHRSELVSTGSPIGVGGGPGVTSTGKIIVGHNRAESVSGCKLSQSPAKIGNSAPVNSMTSKEKDKDTGIHRRSSDSDLSVTPKGNSLCIASERLITATTLMRSSGKAVTQENLDMLEYPFLTMAKYPPGFILHLGATVAARSVKLLERVPNPDEPETRDSWWTELRMEIRSHARALSCNVILGYSEVTAISDDVCVLSATGTAAVINMSYNGDTSQFDLSSSLKKEPMISSLDERVECLKDSKTASIRSTETGEQISSTKELSSSFGGTTTRTTSMPLSFNHGCAMCHIPYSQSSVPFNVKMTKCAVCNKGKVPDVLLSTIEIPECLQITGKGCFIQAQVVRAKKDLRSESNAKEISDGLPFLEYELHRLMINKLKAKGMNAIFGLKTQVAIGEKMMVLIATGTAVYLSALPPPSVPKIVAGNSWTDMAKLKELQKSLQDTVERNREIYQLKSLDPDLQNGKQSDTDDSDDEIPEVDLTTGNKDTCVLEVDDIEDLGIISLLMEPCPPEGFHVVNTQAVPGLHDLEVVRNLRMFTQIWRAKLSVGQASGSLAKHFTRLLQTIYFKLRAMIPCAICDLRIKLDLPESDEVQVLVTGMALGLGEVSKFSKMRRKTVSGAAETSSQLVNGSVNMNRKPLDDELIFSLDEDQSGELSPSNQTGLVNPNYGSHSLRLRKGSPSRSKYNAVRFAKHMPLKERYGVDITPLSYVPGGRIEKYLGNLNFFFIRESTSIRENGGISGFVHSFITELLGVVRAHVSALGGNAMVSFYMTELLLVDNQHKNQGQCLVSLGGDVVHVSYFSDD